LPYNFTDNNPETIDKAYDLISEYYDKTCELQKESTELNNLETLFDLQKSSYKQLKSCKAELMSLKQMWDLVALIDMQFDSWKKTLWDQIDVDQLLALIKDMTSK